MTWRHNSRSDDVNEPSDVANKHSKRSARSVNARSDSRSAAVNDARGERPSLASWSSKSSSVHVSVRNAACAVSVAAKGSSRNPTNYSYHTYHDLVVYIHHLLIQLSFIQSI